jgi:hypothetical protein
MTTVVPVKGISGKIYRFVMVSRSTDLPEFPGVYTFAFPIRYPGAPLESVYLGRAPHELRIDVLQSDLRAAAIEQGATMIGYIEVTSRVAQRRIYNDLIQVMPDRLPFEEVVQVPPRRVRQSRIAR